MYSLSIIIPVYNVEKYLERCLDSIIDDNNNCEIILIDDGSTDASPSICDRYSEIHDNIIVIHKTNGGLSDARNVGIENASGDYLWFIDSDDYIEHGAVRKVHEILNQHPCDLLVIKSIKVDDVGNTRDEVHKGISEGIYSCDEYIEALNRNPRSVIFCAPYHICKRELVIKNQLKFYKGILHEDELWTPQLILISKRIYFTNEILYFHYIRNGSIMHSNNNIKSGQSYYIIFRYLMEVFDKSTRSNLYYMRDHLVTMYLQTIWKCPNPKGEDIVDRKMLYKNAYYPKTKMKCLLYMISPRLYRWIHYVEKRIFERKKINTTP